MQLRFSNVVNRPRNRGSI